VIRVVILFGGRSAEHEVSILSARHIWQALDRQRFVPVLISIDKQGRWRREPEATLAGAVGDPRRLRLDAAAPVVRFEDVITPDDIVFSVIHGTTGEDGTLQGLLELADIGYVGAGVLGSAIGMDKDVSKRLLRDAGIPVVAHRVVTARDLPARLAAIGEELGYPLFAKPANAGSSIGVVRVAAPSELGRRCARRWRWTARCCSSGAWTRVRSSVRCWETRPRRRRCRARSSSATATTSIRTKPNTSIQMARRGEFLPRSQRR
jgi:D-alanine-D-alanine ligase